MRQTVTRKLFANGYAADLEDDAANGNASERLAGWSAKSCRSRTEWPKTRKYPFLYPYVSHFPISHVE